MHVHLRKASVLALRNFCVTVAGTAGAMPVAHSLADFKAVGLGWLFALYAGATAAVLTFLLNLVEDNSTVNLGTKSFTTAAATKRTKATTGTASPGAHPPSPW